MSIPRDCPGVCFSEQAAWSSAKVFPGDRDDDARYSPFASITGSGAGIALATRNGKRRLRLFGDAAAAATVRYRFKYDGASDEFDDRPTSNEAEISGVELVFNSGGLGTLDFLDWVIRDADDTTDVSWVCRITASNTVLRRNTGGTALSSVNWTTGLSSGTEYSIRFVYTPATSNAAADGTIKIYLASGDSVLNDANGAATTWTEVVNTTHSGGRPLRPPTPSWVSSAASINNTPNSGTYTGAAGYYADIDTPVAATDGSQSWTRIHRMQIEKSTCWYRPSTGKILVRMTARHLEELLPGTTQRSLKINVYTSLANMVAGTPVAFSSSTTAVTADSEGYYRATFEIDGLEPDTTYWFEVHNTLNSGAGAYVMRSGTGEPFEYAVLRTPAARGSSHAMPARFYPDGCGNQHSGQGRDKHLILARRISDAGDTSRLHVHLPLGDLIGGGYMDEHQWDRSGVEAEGAQTRQAMSDSASLVQHGYWMLALHSVAWCFPAGDDHDRSVNDAAMTELLADNTTNPWTKSGRPNPISAGAGEYTITPRALADLLLAHARSWIFDCYPQSTADAEIKAYRFFPSVTDFKYGSTNWNDHDFGYVYSDLGKMRLFLWDTRGTAANMNNDSTATLTGIAKSWMSSAINSPPSDLKGAVHAVPTYVVGFDESGGTLKDMDIQYASNQDVTALAAERTLHFVTDTNSSGFAWSVIISNDHHIDSVTTKRSPLALGGLSSKVLAQIGDGGAYSLAQDPAGLGDSYLSLYDHISNYGLNILRTATTYEVRNESSGRSSVTCESIGVGTTVRYQANIGRSSGARNTSRERVSTRRRT